MTMKEKLSALIDGELNELDERRTLKAMGEERGLRDTWERYHLIRAVMTRQLEMLARPGLPERVMALLDTTDETGSEGSRVPLRFWPLIGGFAAAASIAAIAILTLQTFQSPTLSSGTTVAVAGPSTSVAATTPASRTPVTTVAKTSAVAPAATPDLPAAAGLEDRLDLYLVGHNEFMPIAGMGGMLPYVRVVTHNKEQP